MQFLRKFLGSFFWGDFFSDNFLTFSLFLLKSLTFVKFFDMSRFSRQVVILLLANFHDKNFPQQFPDFHQNPWHFPDQGHLRPLRSTLKAYYFFEGATFWTLGGSDRSIRTCPEVYCVAKNALNSFSPGASLQTLLGDHTTFPRSANRLWMEIPSPIPHFIRCLNFSPLKNFLWAPVSKDVIICHWGQCSTWLSLIWKGFKLTSVVGC